MGIFDFAWNYVIIFLIVLTVLIFVHEWGHYWVARKAGVRVEVFSIGFGPEVFGWNDAAGTRWKFGAIPLGGYVKMFGEAASDIEEGTGDKQPAERPLSEEEKKVSFNHKTLGQRTAIVFAGPLANFIFAAAVVALLTAIVGTPRATAVIGDVTPGSAADAAGLIAGDRIIRVGDAEVALFEDLREIVSASAGRTLALEIQRGDDVINVSLTPKAVTGPDGTEIGLMGVRANPEAAEYRRLDPLSAVWAGLDYTVGTIGQIFAVIGQMISGDRSTDELGGPLRIAQISGDVAQNGTIELIMFMAALSINLGLINLFPIPVLDGGRLVFYAAEFVRGKPLGERAEEYGMRFGLALVLFLVVFVTWNDIRHLLSL